VVATLEHLSQLDEAVGFGKFCFEPIVHARCENRLELSKEGVTAEDHLELVDGPEF
jgi:hypothetical protein